MKTKIGTQLDEEIIQMLKEQAARESRSISDVIQDALVHYFNLRSKGIDQRRKTLERACSQPFGLTTQDLTSIIGEGCH